MKSKFVDRLAPKKIDRPYEKSDPYPMKTMEYRNRSGGFIRAGQDFGTGVNQPVGHFGKPKETVECLPMTSRTINGNDYTENY